MASPQKIRALTFDLDNTLWDTTSTIINAEEILYNWLSSNTPKLTQQFSPDELLEHRLKVAKNNPHLHHNVSQLRLTSLEQALREAGYTSGIVANLALSAFNVFYDARQKVVMYEGVFELLERLKTRFTLGSITNGNANLEIIGLDHFFDFSLSAETVGASKPAPAPFLKAIEQANCESYEIIHIGDHPKDDIKGAQQCGLHTIWLNQKMVGWKGEHPPSAIIKDISELITAIDVVEKNLNNE